MEWKRKGKKKKIPYLGCHTEFRPKTTTPRVPSDGRGPLTDTRSHPCGCFVGPLS